MMRGTPLDQQTSNGLYFYLEDQLVDFQRAFTRAIAKQIIWQSMEELPDELLMAFVQLEAAKRANSQE